MVLSSSALPLPSGAIATNYRLLRSTQTARLFQYGAQNLALSANGTQADLDSVTRQIKPGDLILFDAANGQTATPNTGTIQQSAPSSNLFSEVDQFGYGGENFLRNFDVEEFGGVEIPHFQWPPPPAPPLQLTMVSTYTEAIWYADNPGNPTVNPSTATTPSAGIAVLHSELTFTSAVSVTDPTSVVIRYGWQDAGVVIPPPATSFTGAVDLVAVKPPNFAPGQQTVLLEDANGDGESATGTVSSTSTDEMQLSDPVSPALDPPIDVLTNLLPFTRGKTVANEVLGSGDATVAGQTFTLAKSPLTYLLSEDSSSGANYTSTLQVWVNSVEWTEQPSFYGQPPEATIFLTQEDENNVTHVQFGDGVNGARLPTGTNNVVARYRFGSGEDAPAAGALTVIATPQPGLAAILNPVAAGGGADPQPSSQIRKYAPLSALAFGRAISGDDYEAIAASTPSVNRANAVWSFDPLLQRTVVTVYVGDDSSAQSAAQLALSGDADPNRPVSVQLAQPVALTVSLTLAVDPAYVEDTVSAAAVVALADPDAGLFGANRIGIGEAIYKSQIFAACLSVPGAVAVHDLTVTGAPAGACYRFDPGQGGYFTLDPVAGLNIVTEVANG